MKKNKLIGVVASTALALVALGGVVSAAPTAPVGDYQAKGTNVEQGREILKKSGIALTVATDMTDAAKKVVAAARGGR